MKQPQNSPLSVAEQVAIIYSGINGLIDEIPVSKIREFSTKLISYLEKSKPEYRKLIETTQKFDLEAENIVKTAVEVIIKDLN
jgi:F-type H+-transporting ATPase subunit alpha